VFQILFMKGRMLTHIYTHSVRDYVTNIVLGIRHVGKNVTVKCTVLWVVMGVVSRIPADSSKESSGLHLHDRKATHSLPNYMTSYPKRAYHLIYCMCGPNITSTWRRTHWIYHHHIRYMVCYEKWLFQFPPKRSPLHKIRVCECYVK